MKTTHTAASIPAWIRPLLLALAVWAVGTACNEESGASSPSGGGSSGGGASGGGGGGGADGTAGMGGEGGSVGEFPGESDAERAERLGQVLEESLGDFDEVLHDEQEEVAAVGRNTEGFGGGGGGSGGISLGEQAGGGGGGGSVAVVNEGAIRPESPTASMSEDEIRERTPEDVPMAADDDIIARQLREAALAEEDAELRERLWEEYRKYKGL